MGNALYKHYNNYSKVNSFTLKKLLHNSIKRSFKQFDQLWINEQGFSPSPAWFLKDGTILNSNFFNVAGVG